MRNLRPVVASSLLQPAMGFVSLIVGTIDPMNLSVTPNEAWEPLPDRAWDEDAARHLFRRAGWTARATDVAKAVDRGLLRTLEQLFPPEPPVLEKPESIAQLEAALPELLERQRAASEGDAKRARQRDLRERSRQALLDLSLDWLRFAARPDAASFAKWTHFLGDVYVVSYEKVQNAALIYAHEVILHRHGLGAAPALTKAVSRSPAMIAYLDLNGSRKAAPNENFARELFELFTLGEGNYSEADIKEAARAFTGYRQRLGEVRIVQRQHDDGRKTVFGQTGRFDGDGVIDLIYQQPAAGTFLPREMARFYLTSEPLPGDYIEPLGRWWAETGFDLRRLARRFFGSRLFFESSYRGNYIKSPLQFYLGLVQDLDLTVPPLPRQVLGSLRQMGQTPFRPPNVRGWVGGRQWINSSTLAARRQLVQALFTPIDEPNLNADDRRALAAARAAGAGDFTVPTRWGERFSGFAPAEAADNLIEALLAKQVSVDFEQAVRAFILEAETPSRRVERIRDAAVTLLQSPDYQLC